MKFTFFSGSLQLFTEFMNIVKVNDVVYNINIIIIIIM